MQRSKFLITVFICFGVFSFIISCVSSLPSVVAIPDSQSGLLSQDEVNSSGPDSSMFAGGVAWIDYDNDGWDDVFVPNQSLANSRLFHNESKNLSGSPCGASFCDVTLQSGIALQNLRSSGAAVADYDGDGFDDIYVTNIGSRNALLKNQGNGSFVDVSASVALNIETKQSYAAAFADVNGDGFLDIYVGNWALSSLPCQENDLYISTLDAAGQRYFVNQASQVGVADVGCTFAVAFTDYDNDNDLDLVVVNDNICRTDARLNNRFYRNDGITAQGAPVFVSVGEDPNFGYNHTLEGGRLKDISLMQGMGIAVGDYNNDGFLDIYRTNISAGYLSTNNGNGTFTTRVFAPASPLAEQPGDGVPSQSCGDVGTTGWGAAFIDIDNDSYLDLFRVNRNFSNDDRNSYFANLAGELSEVHESIGFDHPSANGLAVADYDLDGDQDLLVHSGAGVIGLYENSTTSSNQWLGFKLKGLAPNTSAVGAKIRVTTRSGATYLSEVSAGSSHGSSHSFVQHFGIAQGDVIESVVVDWPQGCRDRLTGTAIKMNQVSMLQQSQLVCGSISGRVVDATGAALAGVEIRVNLGANPGAVTDVNGRYVIDNLIDYDYYLQVFKAGYQTVSKPIIIDGKRVTYDVSMSLVP